MFSIAVLGNEIKEVDTELKWKEKGSLQKHAYRKSASYGELGHSHDNK